MYDSYLQLLQRLIETPSLSREESATAGLLVDFFTSHGITPERLHNNVWARSLHFDPTKPTLLLNSHHDTVKPNPAYTRPPFEATISDGKLYGLGSNDAGGSVVSLLAAFLHFYPSTQLKYNLIIALTGEEECSGQGGIESLLPHLGTIDFAIVGEPTLMQMAIAERGLMVLDCTAHGKAGHAAREEGDNAIYHAMQDIAWFEKYRFPRTSPLFGAVKTSVTLINAGTQHNVIPAQCTFTVDVRITECYTNEEVLEIIRNHVSSEVTPRSTRLHSSSIPTTHPIVQAGLKLGLSTYGSPTMSDAALLQDIPTLKIGVGDSARSHTADEFIYIAEIEDGIAQYIKLLHSIL